MELYQKISDFKPLDAPLAITIGNFDGVHPGHRHVIQHTVSTAKSMNGKSIVITFSNHPSEILPGRKTVRPICTPQHKKMLLEALSVDYLVQIPFTLAFSEQTAEEFIQSAREYIPFNHLVLGYDARFGKNRKGDRETIKQLAERAGFTTDYIEKVDIDGITVSSTKIRSSIQRGDFDEASRLLGRPYSIFSNVVKGRQIGTRIGFPTANLDVANLCLPPYGVYAVQLKIEQQLFRGVANLGIAPTLKNSLFPTFEVFLLDEPSNMLGKPVELLPQKFLRPEIKFSSPDLLKQQISQDIQSANNYFRNANISSSL